MLVIKGFIAYAIPDVPHWVAVEMAKIEFRRREIEKDSSSTLLLAAAASSSANTTNANNTHAPNSRNNSINLTVGNSMETEDRAIQTELVSLTPVAVTPRNTPVKEANPLTGVAAATAGGQQTVVCQVVTDSPSASLSASEATELSSRYQRPRPMRSAMHASSLTTATY